MLDQSFSPENFKIIFHIENRKGNIDRTTHLTEEYIKCVLQEKSQKELLKEKKKDYKALVITKDEYNSCKDEINDKIKEIRENKDKELIRQLQEISKNVNNKDFSIKLTSEETDYNKHIYKTDTTLETFYSIKQLQYNIRKIFKVKQSDRYTILKQIKILLNDKFPKFVIRTDIKSFYESIPHNLLLKKIENNNLLSYRSKQLIFDIINEYESVKDKSIYSTNTGIPRGIGISAYLSELYMRDIDSKIKSIPNVIFYSRYVDDIFIIIAPDLHTDTNMDIVDYWNKIENVYKDADLTLAPHDITNSKTELLSLLKEADFQGLNYSFDYLGYKLLFTEIIDKKDKNKYKISFKLSDNKKWKIENRLEKAINHYNDRSKYNQRQARKELYDCLKFLTGNTNLINSKKGIKVGIYYSNSLLDKDGEAELNDFDSLMNELVDTKLSPYIKLNVDKTRMKKYIQCNFSFFSGYTEKRFHKFSVDEFRHLRKVWQE